MPSLLPGTTMISTCFTFQTFRLNISDDLHRQGKCNRSTHTGTCSCYRWPTRTSCIFGCHEEIWKKKKTVVNSSQSNYTTENYLHIASIIMIILNNGYFTLEIYVMCWLWCIGSCISHILHFLSAMFDEGHVTLTVQFTMQYVQ